MARPRFSLRWKIALLTAGLLVLAVAALAVFTVYQPWRAQLEAQKHLTLERVRPLSPIIVQLTAEGVSFRADVMRELVLNSSSTPGQELLFALIYNDKGVLLESVSVANTQLLSRIAPRLLALYRTQPLEALQQLAVRRVGVQPLAVTLKLEGNPAPVGRMLLGLSTSAIDAEARASLFRELAVLAATLLLALIGAALVARRLARPLGQLSLAMGRMQDGEFDAELEVEARARDEIGDLARAFNSMLQGLRERERLRGTLGRYVSGAVAERILAESDDLSLRGEMLHVTALFLDVRGFTSLAELLTPRELVALLNDYFQVMVEAVQRRGGTVNKFIGDAALCLWGAPRAVATPELAAVRAALEIQTGARSLSESRIKRGLPVVDFGIGINAGEALAGNLGAAERLEYTVIGDAVNLAQRLEGQAKAGEVLVSQAIYEKVSAQVEAQAREPVKLKGKSEAVRYWEVRALKLGAALLAIACALMPLGCERDTANAADELTITVRGDRRELELQEKALQEQEKALQEREEELRAQKAQVDAHIGELVNSVGAANAAQRQEREEELRKAREQDREVAARVQSLLAEKSQIDARRAANAQAVDPAPGLASSANLAKREADVASREARLAERDADLARREKALADREAAATAAERTATKASEQSAAQAASARQPREVPQASAIEQRHNKLIADLAARGLLIADLPVEDQPLNAEVRSAQLQGDFALASDLLSELARAIKQLKVDSGFVQQKMIRLQNQLQTQRASSKLTDAQRKDIDTLLREVTISYNDGLYEKANGGLNRIARILDAGASSG